MTGLGEITGRAFREFTALNAYRWDIIGSILGTLAFTLISFLRAPSWVWPVVTLVALWALYGFALPWVSRIAMVIVIGALVFESLGAGVSWSPYYKVDTTTYNVGTAAEFTHHPGQRHPASERHGCQRAPQVRAGLRASPTSGRSATR